MRFSLRKTLFAVKIENGIKTGDSARQM